MTENMNDPVNTGFVLDMQRKLYRWSHGNAQQKFSDLFNWVCDRRNLEDAWQKLAGNSGSRTPGIDGMNRRKVEERPDGVAGFLEEIREQLRTGNFRPDPVREKLIPKPGKPGQFRPLGIPTLSDRLVQMALKNVLEPIFEADFYPNSYGFRPGRSALDALAMVQRQLMPNRSGPSKFAHVIEGDIKGCFDNIDHHVLMERVRRRVGDRKVLRLLLAFLKAGVMSDGRLRPTATGTPQGGIISPLLANVLLTGLDERYRRWNPAPREARHCSSMRRIADHKKGRPSFIMVRYADDFVILVSGDREKAEMEKRHLAEFLRKELRLELSPEKTLVTPATEGFVFLGYRVLVDKARHSGKAVGKLRIPWPKLQQVRDRIKEITGPSTVGLSLETLLRVKLNPLVIGWRNYFRYATSAGEDFRRLDFWLINRIRRWLRKKYGQKLGSHAIRRKFQRRAGNGWRWAEGRMVQQHFDDAGTANYWLRGSSIKNKWLVDDDPERPYSAVEKVNLSVELWSDLLW